MMVQMLGMLVPWCLLKSYQVSFLDVIKVNLSLALVYYTVYVKLVMWSTVAIYVYSDQFMIPVSRFDLSECYQDTRQCTTLHFMFISWLPW